MSAAEEWTVQTAEVVGVMCPLQMSAEFSSGRAVFGISSGSFLIHRATDPGGVLRGDLLHADEWDGLVTSEEAFRLPHPVRVDRPVVGWVFRSKTRKVWYEKCLSELENVGGQVGKLIATPDARGVVVCLVDPLKAGTCRDEWARRAHDDAWRTLLQGQDLRSRREALRLAQRAFCLSRRLMERYVAMLALTYSLAGLKADSEGVLGMARNSKGEPFVRRVDELRERLVDELAARRGSEDARRPRRSTSTSEFAAGQRGLLDAWKREAHDA